ncbi:hypothetical protein L195_g028936 [Trifolium pratense]|uniref:Uncharacterized protein n=1 Tax=Trifolium pratense TaxID=57577 RepID=A0A2K3L3C2_TRIPR|nr:hypothetical protein L195_g028936 [Trifolium pratense]
MREGDQVLESCIYSIKASNFQGQECIQRGNFRDSCVLKEILHLCCSFNSSWSLTWRSDGRKLQLAAEALEACASHRYQWKRARNPVSN